MLLLIVLLVYGDVCTGKADRMSRCVTPDPHNQDYTTTLVVNCSHVPGSVIRVRRAFWGAHKDKLSAACHSLPGDCEGSINNNNECFGHNICKFTRKTINIIQCTNGQSAQTSYIQYEYECVERSTFTDICSSRRLVATEGSLISPGYPGYVNESINCSCQIVSSRPVNITITAVDISFYHNTDAFHNPCGSKVILNNVTSCRGNLHNWNSVITRYTNERTVHIQILIENEVKSILWMLYKASDKITMQCGSPLSTTVTREPQLLTTEHEESPSCSQMLTSRQGDGPEREYSTTVRTQKKEEKALVAYVISGWSIAVIFLGVNVTMAACICYKRRKRSLDRRDKSKDSERPFYENVEAMKRQTSKDERSLSRNQHNGGTNTDISKPVTATVIATATDYEEIMLDNSSENQRHVINQGARHEQCSTSPVYERYRNENKTSPSIYCIIDSSSRDSIGNEKPNS